MSAKNYGNKKEEYYDEPNQHDYEEVQGNLNKINISTQSKNVENNKASKKNSKTKKSKQTSQKEIVKGPNKAELDNYQKTLKKGMNVRVNIYKTNEKCTKLEKDLEEKTKKLEKINKEKDGLKTYLTKLEKMAQQKTDTDNLDYQTPKLKNNLVASSIKKSINTINQSEHFTEQSVEKTETAPENNLTISMTGNCPIITMDDGEGVKNVIKSKTALMKFLYKIYTDNQNLKNFQTQVFNLSKNYDDINNILSESSSGFVEIAKKTENEEIQKIVDEKLQEMNKQVKQILAIKQNEYNEQLAKKEEEIEMLTTAYNNIYKEILQKRTDKLHEIKTVENLNSQIDILETKLAYLKNQKS